MPTAALIDVSPAYRRGLVEGLGDHGWVLRPREELRDVADDDEVVLIRLRTPDPELVPHRGPSDGAPLLVLVPEPIAEDHVTLVRAGASAVANADDEPHRLARLLDAMVDDHVVLPMVTQQRLIAIARSAPSRPAIADEERSWLTALASGISVRALAEGAGWSDRAMHRALGELYDRLGVENRDMAVAWAARNELLEDD